ncbi:hypothetical protein CRM22_004937 [Opisthorchis felineus]|uniref:C-CAP/cofactor C-like domain-containing protein n=2 Tax=Opisthorchis felineus TaxID=147828 RepID=A0A4S2M0D9_OPIFE|nr:hypothetical protein CRM22_004937 [Opisthorchis felineus]
MDKLESLLDRLEKVVLCLESSPDTGMNRCPQTRTQFTSKGDPKSSNSLKEYDDLISGPLAEFLTLSKKIGGDVKEQSDLVQKCFVCQRQIIENAAQHGKPSESHLEGLLKQCGEPISAVVQYKDKKRSSQYFNHLSAVAESILALGWVSVTPAPAPYIQNMQEAAQFFINRVIKDFKEKDPQHLAWTKALTSLWDGLRDYVRKNHTTGLSWNVNGTPCPSTGGGVPAPPPAFSDADLVAPAAPSGDPTRNALFAELNRGEGITAGLRKVTDDMKTHKNPELRAGAGPQPRSGPPQKAPKPTASNNGTKQATPVMELRGNKWVVENYQNQHLKITETEPKQTVYVYKCVGCTIEVKGKINSIMIDNCKKTGVVFGDLISALDIVNCQSVQVQSMGQLQTVNVDKTDGCQIYLSSQSLHADIITAKSSELNVLVPKANGDYDEFPVPEQFKTKFTGKGLQTTQMDSI